MEPVRFPGSCLQRPGRDRFWSGFAEYPGVAPLDTGERLDSAVFEPHSVEPAAPVAPISGQLLELLGRGVPPGSVLPMRLLGVEGLALFAAVVADVHEGP